MPYKYWNNGNGIWGCYSFGHWGFKVFGLWVNLKAPWNTPFFCERNGYLTNKIKLFGGWRILYRKVKADV